MNYYTQFLIPGNLLENFDVDLQTFYHEVLCKELALSGKAAAVRQALKEVVHVYKKPTVDSNASDILYDTREKRCAYVLKHCACFGSAVAKHFLQLLKAHPACLLAATQRRVVSLCCLGGGPGTEAVSIAKVVSALDNVVGVGIRKEKLHLRVQVVDSSGEWRTTAEFVRRTMNESPELCDPERLVVSFETLEADLTRQQWGEPVRRALGEADIVSMVYFVSAVNGSRAHKRCVPMLKKILDLAKPESLFFFLDSAKELHFGAVQSAVSERQDLSPVYGPFVQEFHTLSIPSIRRFIELYFVHFDAILCLSNCFVTVGVWTNTTKGLPVRSEVGGRPGSGTSVRVRNKRAKHNTRRQEWFRQRIEKLLLQELKMDFTTEDLRESFWETSDFSLPCEAQMLCAAKAKQKRIFIP